MMISGNCNFKYYIPKKAEFKAYTVYALYRNTVYAFAFLSLGGCKTEVRFIVSSSLTAYSDCYPSGRELSI